jgi:hypothetical protein
VKNGEGAAYEFMADFTVHIKVAWFPDNSSPTGFMASRRQATENLKEQYNTVPYFCLPGTIAEKAIAKSCLGCFDYTNG